MSDSRSGSPPEFTPADSGGAANYLESLSKEDLESLINYAFDETDIDIESLEALMSVYKGREGEQPSDTAEAWERFKLYYSGSEETFPYEDADNPKQTENIKKSANPNKGKRTLRYSYIAAALILIMAAFLYVTPAGAYVINAVTNWTNGIFWFGSQNTEVVVSKELDDLHDALAENGITDKVAPTRLPKGFVLHKLSVLPTPDRLVINALFADDSKELIIQIAKLRETPIHSYERDENDVEVYRSNGIEFNIMTNNGKTNVVWAVGTNECLISGDLSVGEAKLMIDSIYER